MNKLTILRYWLYLTEVSKRFSLYLVFFIIAIFLISCAVKPRIAPIKKTITIFYTGDLKLKNIARIAKFVRQEKSKNPCLFIVNGKIFTEESITTLYRGEVEIAILNSAGIDAIVLTPDFLRFGIQRAQELINKGDFFFLGANLSQTNQSKPFAHEYLIKDLAGTKVAIIGLLYDSINPYLNLSGIEPKDPIHTTKRLVPLLRMRSDIVGLVTTNAETLALSDIDFTIGANNLKGISVSACQEDEILCRFDIFLGDNNRIIDFKNSVINIADSISDELVTTTIKKYQSRSDSILNSKIVELNKELNIQDLTDKITQAILTETKADAVIMPNPLIRQAIPKGTITYQTLFDYLNFTKNLFIITLKGKEIKDLETSKLNLVLSAKLKKIQPANNYKVVITTEFLAFNHDWQDKAITLTDKTLIAMLSNYLKKGGK